MVDWPFGRREELLGASARAGRRSGNDERAVIFGDGGREVAVWLYPDDPDLPGLRRGRGPPGSRESHILGVNTARDRRGSQWR